jgi:hypothetical protein
MAPTGQAVCDIAHRRQHRGVSALHSQAASVHRLSARIGAGVATLGSWSPQPAANMKLLRVIAATQLLMVMSVPAAAQRVHALIVGDASPSAQWGVLQPNIQLDVIGMSVLFWNHVPSRQLNLIVLTIETDELATPRTIFDVLDEFRPAPDDVVVVYFSGHGGVDDRGHYLWLAGGRLYREELRQRMQRSGARLVVLLTDCCSTRSDGQRYYAPAPRITPPSTMAPALRSLLNNAAGVVDINASGPNESAFFVPTSDQFDVMPGSLFTTALVEFVTENREKPLRWDDLLRSVSFRVHLAFRNGYPDGAKAAKGAEVQRDQNVHAFDYPGMPVREGPRTGMTIRDHNGRGAMITSVSPDSPAARAYDLLRRQYVALRPSQLIVNANGQTIHAADDFLKATAESPQVMRLSVEDASGSRRDYLLRLRY